MRIGEQAIRERRDLESGIVHNRGPLPLPLKGILVGAVLGVGVMSSFLQWGLRTFSLSSSEARELYAGSLIVLGGYSLLGGAVGTLASATARKIASFYRDWRHPQV